MYGTRESTSITNPDVSSSTCGVWSLAVPVLSLSSSDLWLAHIPQLRTSLFPPQDPKKVQQVQVLGGCNLASIHDLGLVNAHLF